MPKKKLKRKKPSRFNSMLEAVHAGNLQAVQEFIQKGANTNVEDKVGQTPLNLAIDLGHDAIAQHLLQSGANPNKTSWIESSTNGSPRKEITPLILATQKNNPVIMRTLLQYGARLDKSVYRFRHEMAKGIHIKAQDVATQPEALEVIEDALEQKEQVSCSCFSFLRHSQRKEIQSNGTIDQRDPPPADTSSPAKNTLS